MTAAWRLAVLCSLVLGCHPAQPARLWKIEDKAEITAHRLGRIEPLRRIGSCRGDGSEPLGYGEAVRVRLRVDVRGAAEVQSIEGDGFDLTGECAELVKEATQTWRYRPFATPGGAPVAAEFTELVPVYPPERWRSPRVAFPDAADTSAARIVLERLDCFGDCPAYRVELLGDGTAVFTGWRHVAETGAHRGAIERAEFAALIDAFRAADFYSMLDSYASGVTDHPAYRVTLELAGRSATVTDYDGLSVGMPTALRRLEDEIDRVAVTEQWIRRRRGS